MSQNNNNNSNNTVFQGLDIQSLLNNLNASVSTPSPNVNINVTQAQNNNDVSNNSNNLIQNLMNILNMSGTNQQVSPIRTNNNVNNNTSLSSLPLLQSSPVVQSLPTPQHQQSQLNNLTLASMTQSQTPQFPTQPNPNPNHISKLTTSINNNLTSRSISNNSSSPNRLNNILNNQLLRADIAQKLAQQERVQQA